MKPIPKLCQWSPPVRIAGRTVYVNCTIVPSYRLFYEDDYMGACCAFHLDDAVRFGFKIELIKRRKK